MNPPIPFGTHTKHYGKIHHFEWLNQLFLWPFSSSLFVCLPEGTTGSGETNLVPGFFPIAMFDQRTHLSTYPIHISSVSLKDMKNHMKSHTKSWFIPLIWHIKPSKLRCVCAARQYLLLKCSTQLGEVAEKVAIHGTRSKIMGKWW